MNKPYKLLLALGIAAASLSSCSRSNYAFNNNAPASLSSEKIQDKASAETVAVATPEAKPTQASPLYETATVVASRPATAPAEAGKEVAKNEETKVKEVAQPTVAATPEVVATKTPSPSAKPSLVQRLVLKSVAKQLDKIQKKQAVAGTQQTAVSKKGRAALIALAGLVLAVIGIAIAGGSLSGGSGAGVAIGIILYYLGVIAFLVGLIILVIHLVNGD